MRQNCEVTADPDIPENNCKTSYQSYSCCTPKFLLAPHSCGAGRAASRSPSKRAFIKQRNRESFFKNLGGYLKISLNYHTPLRGACRSGGERRRRRASLPFDVLCQSSAGVVQRRRLSLRSALNPCLS